MRVLSEISDTPAKEWRDIRSHVRIFDFTLMRISYASSRILPNYWDTPGHPVGLVAIAATLTSFGFRHVVGFLQRGGAHSAVPTFGLTGPAPEPHTPYGRGASDAAAS